MNRAKGRDYDQLREIRVKRDIIKYPLGSAMVEFGDTQVICTATVDEHVPVFLKGSGKGWLTAEYGMLPASTDNRIQRDKKSGRVYEIQRLIGRALRAVVDLGKIGERTIRIDCDVIQADGGTRTASVTGGFIALAGCLSRLYKKRMIGSIPLNSYLAAISVGIVERNLFLDLDYSEDSIAEVDMNVAANDRGEIVEVQGTAEKGFFSKKVLDDMLDLALKGIDEIIKIEKELIKL